MFEIHSVHTAVRLVCEEVLEHLFILERSRSNSFFFQAASLSMNIFLHMVLFLHVSYLCKKESKQKSSKEEREEGREEERQGEGRKIAERIGDRKTPVFNHITNVLSPRTFTL